VHDGNVIPKVIPPISAVEAFGAPVLLFSVWVVGGYVAIPVVLLGEGSGAEGAGVWPWRVQVVGVQV
jgi:hypothetical protein